LADGTLETIRDSKGVEGGDLEELFMNLIRGYESRRDGAHDG
jgi:hypothetical protein